MFPNKSGLKQGDAFSSPLLINLALEYGIRKVQAERMVEIGW
jgi:hypothetical protein